MNENKTKSVVFGLPFFIFILLITPFVANASIIDVLNSTGNFSDQLMVYYDFNQTGSVALDQWSAQKIDASIPKRLNQTFRGSGDTTRFLGSDCAGVIGNCANMITQSGDNFFNSTNAGLLAGNAHTISIWLRETNATLAQHSLFFTADPSLGSMNEWKALWRTSTGYGTGGDVDLSSPNNNTFGGEWIHWVFVDTGTSQFLYGNGSVRATAGSMTDFIREQVQFCATGSSSRSEFCTSSFDEIAIWNRSLSSGEIATLYSLYPSQSNSPPLLVSPIPNKVLNYSYSGSTTSEIDLSNHFLNYNNYTISFTSDSGSLVTMDTVNNASDTYFQDLENYTAFYNYAIFFDADKNVSNYNIPIVTFSLQDVDRTYETNISACNEFGCTSDIFNITFVATYSQNLPPIIKKDFPAVVNISKTGGVQLINFSEYVANNENTSITLGGSVSALLYDIFIITTPFCTLVTPIFGDLQFCQLYVFKNYNNYDATLQVNAENVTSSGLYPTNFTLCNESGGCIQLNSSLNITDVTVPYPVVTDPIQDIVKNLFVEPQILYTLNLTDHFYNFSDVRIEIINATNDFVNISSGNYSDSYLNVSQLQNSNQTIISSVHPLSNFTVDINIFVSSSNGSINDSFTFTTLNQSDIPAPPQVLTIPAIINLSESTNYTMNVSDDFKNYTGFYIQFNNLTGQTETLTDSIAPDSFQAGTTYNITVEDNETIMYYAFSVARLMNVNISVCNFTNCTNTTFYLNLSGGVAPTQTQEFMCTSGETFSDTSNLDFDLGLDVDISYDLNEYYDNFDDIYIAFVEPFNGDSINLTGGESYSNTSTEDIVVSLSAGNVLTATIDNIPEAVYFNISACNENGCKKTELALCVPASTSASFLRGVFRDIVNFFASLFPDAEDLTLVERIMYMLFTMIVTMIVLFFFLIVIPEEFVTPLLWFTVFIEFLWFIFFVIIGYVPVVVIILLLLGLLALAWFRFNPIGTGGG